MTKQRKLDQIRDALKGIDVDDMTTAEYRIHLVVNDFPLRDGGPTQQSNSEIILERSG